MLNKLRNSKLHIYSTDPMLRAKVVLEDKLTLFF